MLTRSKTTDTTHELPSNTSEQRIGVTYNSDASRGAPVVPAGPPTSPFAKCFGGGYDLNDEKEYSTAVPSVIENEKTALDMAGDVDVMGVTAASSNMQEMMHETVTKTSRDPEDTELKGESPEYKTPGWTHDLKAALEQVADEQTVNEELRQSLQEQQHIIIASNDENEKLIGMLAQAESAVQNLQADLREAKAKSNTETRGTVKVEDTGRVLELEQVIRDQQKEMERRNEHTKNINERNHGLMEDLAKSNALVNELSNACHEAELERGVKGGKLGNGNVTAPDAAVIMNQFATVLAPLIEKVALIIPDKSTTMPGVITTYDLSWSDSSSVDKAIVSHANVLSRMPREGDSGELKAFAKATSAGLLLLPFTQKGLGHAQYVAVRRGVAIYVGAIVYLDHGSHQKAVRAIWDSIVQLATDCSNLQMVKASLIGAEEADKLTLELCFQAFDVAFAAPTKGLVRDDQIKTLESLTISQGVMPSGWIDMALHVYMRQHKDLEVAVEETRLFVSKRLDDEAKLYPALGAFVLYKDNLDSQDKPLDQWRAQFKVLEAKDAFKTAVSAAKGTTPRSAPPTGGGGGGGGGGGDASSELKELMKALGEAIKGNALKTRGGAPSINALGAGRAGALALDDDWVKAHGCPKFPAPSDNRNKYPLNYAKIAEEFGFTLDPELTGKSAMDWVGGDCLCNAWRKVDKSMWFFTAGSKEWEQDGKRSAPTTDRTAKFALYHKVKNCKTVWKELHLYVKAHPEKEYLFDKVEDNAMFA
jgi:hypothetical protein